jgi:ATP-dependent helicase/nuclease subunit B
LELAKMIAALLTAQPELAPRSAIFDLADSLANLLDEMQGEGVSPSVLAGLAVGDHSQHWEKSQTFLNIIAPLFADGARRRARRVANRAALANRAAQRPRDHRWIDRVTRIDGPTHAGRGQTAPRGHRAARV